MSDARTRTFKTISEYRATYYPEGHDPSEPTATEPEDVGKAIAAISLDVIREAILEGVEPAPRHSSAQLTTFSDALAGLTRGKSPGIGAALIRR